MIYFTSKLALKDGLASQLLLIKVNSETSLKKLCLFVLMSVSGRVIEQSITSGTFTAIVSIILPIRSLVGHLTNQRVMGSCSVEHLGD